jgi:hypothetical protein
MAPTSLAFLTEQVELSERLNAERDVMLEPQDLPGRYGRVVRAIDHILEATRIEAVLGGGWAVWRHGYAARLTQDVDIALPADRIEEFQRAASVSGFELLPPKPGRWPKMLHKQTGVQVDILPEGARPGTALKLAPTTIPHPAQMGAQQGRLRYMTLSATVLLKIAAGRERDQGDVVELIRSNADQVQQLRSHLASIHPNYVEAFDQLVKSAAAQAEKE